MIRKRAFWLVLVGLLLLGVGYTAVSPTHALQTAPTAVVSTGALNVRSGPGVQYGVVAVVYSGQTVTLLGRNAASSWVKVQLAGGQQGWVNAALLTAGVAVGSLAVLDAAAPAATAVVTTGALNVRSGPGVQYGAVAVVYSGQTVALLGRNGDGSWVKAQLAGGQQGWVNAALLTANVAVSTLAVLDTSSTPIAVTGIVNTSYLNVRSGPDVAYAEIAVLSGGQQLPLAGRNGSGSWVVVRLPDGRQGWVNASLLILSADVSYLAVVVAPAQPTPPAAQPTAVIATGALNVRSGPGIGYASVATVGNGQVVTLLGRSAAAPAWVKVQLASGVQGWINAAYAQLSVAASSLPVVAGPPALETAVVNTGAANVRGGPGLGYAPVAVVYRGQVVNLLGRNGDGSWVKVQLVNGQQGWINTSLLQLSVGVGSLSVTA
ncbi:MAG: SH3 domain-containing protein [Anaerolineales bacterium]|nr:SH3 domain-containing protein [Anaerolineales bacterium]